MNRWQAWLMLVMCGVGPHALAQTTVDYPDQGAAYAGCQANAASALPFQVNTNLERIACSASKTKQPTCRLVGTNVYRIWGVNRDKNNGDESGSCFDLTGQAAGVNTHRFQTGKTCSSRAPLLNVSYQGNLAGCNSGCEVAAGIGEPGDTVTVLGSGTSAITRVSRMVPTGQTCTVGAEYQNVQPQTTDQCQQQGNLTQCVTADGRTCTVASSGKKFCWEPSEAGIKVSGNEAATKSPEGSAIKQPPKAPNNGGEWQQGGTGQVSVTKGGTTNNYNTTNWNSSYGNQGSGANGGGADGEGNGGSGDGSGEGEGDDGWGEPGQGVGDLYEGTDKTIAGLMGNFFNQAKNAPVMQGVTNFMGVTSSGGQCPVFTVPATQFWDSMTFDGHCSGTWLQLLMACGWVALALSAYFAVRIAVT